MTAEMIEKSHIQRCTKVVQYGCIGVLAMLTIKQIAEQQNVSYEAIRKQVIRYELELQDHILKKGRTQYFDEYAVEFLNSKRKENPVVIIQTDKDDTIRALENENKALLIKVAELQEQLLKEKDQVKLLQQEKIELLQVKDDNNTSEQQPKKKKWLFW